MFIVIVEGLPLPLAARKPTLVVPYRLPALTAKRARSQLTALPQAVPIKMPVSVHARAHAQDNT